MKTVLCYGDSNTWGADPVSRGRFPLDVRWTGVLQAALGGGYRVIEEGLNGRTTVWDDPIEGYKNGKTYLIPCLETHRPLDLLILMLGTNDLKKKFSLTAYDVAQGAGVLVREAQISAAGIDSAAPRVLLLCPPPFAPMAGTRYEEMMEGAEEKSFRLAPHYRRIADEYGCDFLDAGQVIVSSRVDGFHLDASEHQKLGLKLAELVPTIIG